MTQTTILIYTLIALALMPPAYGFGYWLGYVTDPNQITRVVVQMIFDLNKLDKNCEDAEWFMAQGKVKP
ncbi:MAG: hypothetical protein V4772_08525 [Pseudomonadota bacterium]